MPIDLVQHQENVAEKSENLKNIIEDIIAEIEVGSYENIEKIKKQYDNAGVMVEELKTVVPKFDIQPTKRFEQIVFRQMNVLSSAMTQLANGTIPLAIEHHSGVQPSPGAVTGSTPDLLPQKSPEIEKEEEQMNVLSDLMGTITNLSSLLDDTQNPDNAKTLVADMREMFSGLTGLIDDADDPEMVQIQYLIQAIMDLTKDVA